MEPFAAAARDFSDDDSAEVLDMIGSEHADVSQQGRRARTTSFT